MCGIAGYLARQPQPLHVASAMMEALKNRGPDAQHSTRWGADWSRLADDAPAANALIHARLSIIDPRPVSDQPMSNTAGDIWICYNGEVYDWAEHARELATRGHMFKTRSDTEFILNAYAEWGLDMLPKLRGMFAIAILDLRIKKLFLIRDRMGLKPMLYSLQPDGSFAFGSTVRAVLPFLPESARAWNPEAIDAYLAHRYIPAPMTIFNSIARLPNAHWLSLDLQTRETEIKCYWQIPGLSAESATATRSVPEDEWLATLDSAIAMRTVADRPLGVFLSSGIDSSSIAARLAASGHTELNTFTAGFNRADMDESKTARRIADALGFSNLTIPISAKITNDLDRIIADLDEPFADPSAIPTWYLAQETTKHVKVVLGGDGGDEMFAGYKRIEKHLKTSWRRHFLGGQNILPRSGMGDVAGDGVSKLVDELRLDWWRAYSLRFSGFTPTQRTALQPHYKIKTPVYWRSLGQKWLKGSAPISDLLFIDQQNYLPEYILRKGDLCTMAHGLELRAPLLDHHWVSLVSEMSPAQRFTKPPKKLLSAALKPLAELDLFAQKKKGFNPPLATWLKLDLQTAVRKVDRWANRRSPS
jgi:asparagine synthase (glutamine-hydrolysing)